MWRSERGHKWRHNMAYTFWMLDKQGYTHAQSHTTGHPHAHVGTHTHRQIRNTYCFSTATIIRERGSVLRYTYIFCLVFLSRLSIKICDCQLPEERKTVHPKHGKCFPILSPHACLTSTVQTFMTSASATENACVSRAPALVFCGYVTCANRCISLHVEWSLVKQNVLPTGISNTVGHEGKWCNR
jgi:hypothetical protein